MKNCYRTKDATANWFIVLQNNLEQRGFLSSKINPYLFVRRDCIIITCAGDCLIFLKNKKVLDKLIKSLKGEFNLTDKGDLEAFLGIKATKYQHDILEFNQLHLV